MGAKLSDIGKIVAQAISSKRVMEVAGKSISESIPKRTRQGKGVERNLSDPVRLKKLEPKTIRNRKLFVEGVKVEKRQTTLKEKAGDFFSRRKIRKTKTKRTTILKEGVDSKHFRVKKSNLTLTGQMLNDITFSVKKGKVEIFFDNIDADKKAQAVADLGFRFFKVSKAEFKRATKLMAKEVEKILSKINFDGF